MKSKDLELRGKPIVCKNCGGGLPGALRRIGDEYAHEDTKYCKYHIRKQKEERKKAELLAKHISVAKPRIHVPRAPSTPVDKLHV